MKSFAIFIVLLVFSLNPAMCIADEKSPGFQTLPFGSSYQEVKDYVIREGLATRERIDLAEQYTSSQYISVSGFSLGTLTVDITFSFDHEGRFYSFTFFAGSMTAQYLKTDVMENGNYLKEVFKKKYGKPSQCFSPSILNINEGYTSYLCIWKNKKLDIYTGVSEHELKYYALATVEDKSMKKKLENFNKNKAHEGATSGAEKF